MHTPLSVSELNTQIKAILEETFLSIFVQGEVSNLSFHSSGHIYFSLKDSQSSIACVLFKGNIAQHNAGIQKWLKEGLSVEIIGGLGVYPPRGSYQILCKQVRNLKVGELFLAYERLKEELQSKGYFARKLPLPPFPRRVALLTSATGAVLQDMLKIAQKRWNLTEFLILDTPVQGEGAKDAIAKNIAYADNLGVDAIILARGGGSMEDLWAFNEELVAKAIFQAKTPIISAIGHESDVLISDFVADVRAPTPSAAMEILLPDRSLWLLALDEMQENLKIALGRTLSHKTLTLSSIQEQFSLEKLHRFGFQRGELERLLTLLQQRFSYLLTHRERELGWLKETYHSLPVLQRWEGELKALQEAYRLSDPRLHCHRGYAQVTRGGKITPLEQLRDGEVFELSNTQTSILARKLPES